MRPSLLLFLKSGSSKQWLARQARDPYVKARLSSSGQYRARSAFKLMELDKKYNIFRPRKMRVVVDLGAAPGGWSQVAAERLGVGASKERVRTLDPSFILRRREKNEEVVVDDIISDRETSSWSDVSSLPLIDAAEARKELEKKFQNETDEKFIISLDLLPIAPIRGVRTVRQDFFTGGDEVISSLLPTPETRVDVILSDMAPNISGNKIRDEAAGLEICEAVYRFAAQHLQAGGGSSPSDGGTMVLKHFANESTKAFYVNILKPNFYHTYIAKPDASRGESSEYYFVSKGFKGDPYYETSHEEFDVE